MGWSRATHSCAAVRSLLAYLCQTTTNVRSSGSSSSSSGTEMIGWPYEERKKTQEDKEWGERVHVGKLVQVLGAHALARWLLKHL